MKGPKLVFLVTAMILVPALGMTLYSRTVRSLREGEETKAELAKVRGEKANLENDVFQLQLILKNLEVSSLERESAWRKVAMPAIMSYQLEFGYEGVTNPTDLSIMATPEFLDMVLHPCSYKLPPETCKMYPKGSDIPIFIDVPPNESKLVAKSKK